MARVNLFTSKADGMGRAHRFHYCRACRHHQSTVYKNCPKCGSADRIHFPSKAEMHRGATLLFLEQQGHITELDFHPRFNLIVNGVFICVYCADASYKKDGIFTVEDSKPKEFIDKTAVIKIALFEAIWGIKVYIPQQQ